MDEDFNVSISTFTIGNNYPGTVTLENSLVITGNYSQAAGIFNAQNSPIDIDGSFTLSGTATFTAPSTTMNVGAGLTIAATNTFNHNGGTIVRDGTSNNTWTCNGAVFYLVDLSSNLNGTKTFSGCTIPLGANPSIGLIISLTNSSTLTGTGTITINPGKNLSLVTSSTLSGFSGLNWATNAGTLIINNGLTNDFSSYTIFNVHGLTLTSGTLTLPEDAEVRQTFTMSGGTFNAPSTPLVLRSHINITGGTFNHGGGTIVLEGGTSTITCNGVDFNLVDLSFVTTSTKTFSDCQMPLGTDPTIGLRTNFTNGSYVSGTGTLTATVTTVNTDEPFVGFTDLAFISTFNLNSGNFIAPPGTMSVASMLTINDGVFNASSGIISLASSLNINGGTFNHGNGTIVLTGGTQTLNCNGIEFYLVEFASTGTKNLNNCQMPLGTDPAAISAYWVLNNNSAITGNGTLNKPGGATTINSGSSISGFSDAVFGGSFNLNDGIFKVSDVVDFSNSVSIAGGVFDAPSYLLVRSIFAINPDATFNHNNGVINFGGNSVSSLGLHCGGKTFFNVVIDFVSPSGTKTFTDCNLPLGNDPTLTGTIALNNSSLSGTGAFTKNFGAITFNADSSISGFAEMNIHTPLVLNSGSNFTAPSGMLYIGSTFAVNPGAIFNHNNGTVGFAGVVPQSPPCNIVYNLVVFGGGEKHISSDCNIPLGHNPVIIPPLLYVYGVLSGTGELTLNGEINLEGANADIVGFDSLVANGIFYVLTGAELDFASLTSFTINEFFGLDGGTITLPDGALINNPVFLNTGTFNAPSGTMEVTRNLSLGASLNFNHNNGTIIFNGEGQSLSCAGKVFNLVQLNGELGTKALNNCQLPLGNNPAVSNNITLNNNSSLIGSGTLSVAGDTIINVANGLVGFSDVDINGDLFLNTAADFTSPGNLYIKGNLTLDPAATFNHNNGTVFLDGDMQEVNGDLTFFNLQKTNSGTLTFADSSTATVLGELKLQGQQDNLLILRSSTDGNQWNIDPQGTRVISYVDVQDSHNINATAIIANNSLDSGNNINWQFPVPPVDPEEPEEPEDPTDPEEPTQPTDPTTPPEEEKPDTDDKDKDDNGEIETPTKPGEPTDESNVQDEKTVIQEIFSAQFFKDPIFYTFLFILLLALITFVIMREHRDRKHK